MSQIQNHKYVHVHIAADSKHCFDFSGLLSAVGVIDIYLRPYMPEKDFLLAVCSYTS